jgi:hypothetical protein
MAHIVRAMVAVTLLVLLPSTSFAETATNMMLTAALESITSDELYQHVAVLADDVYEGREAGTRGGHAAASYIVKELRTHGLKPAGSNGDFIQSFNRDWRNIHALQPGDDPELAHVIIASGVALLLETLEAFATSGLRMRRSVLFSFWDGEERGLVGSRHWLANPTLPLKDVKLAITVDMAGRLRKGQLFVYGTRTGYGMRRLLSGPVDDPLWLDFTWELDANSDHWSFIEKRVPVVMLHTGLHPDYHRPSDDVEKINREGLRDIARYLLGAIMKAANEDRLPAYRDRGRRETNSMRRTMERPLAKMSLANWPANTPPPRLGISWREDVGEPGSVLVTRVVDGTPAAAAGIAVQDRIYEIDGQPFADATAFQTAIHALLDSGAPEFTFLTERRGHERTVTVKLPSTTITVE